MCDQQWNWTGWGMCRGDRKTTTHKRKDATAKIQLWLSEAWEVSAPSICQQQQHWKEKERDRERKRKEKKQPWVLWMHTIHKCWLHSHNPMVSFPHPDPTKSSTSNFQHSGFLKSWCETKTTSSYIAEEPKLWCRQHRRSRMQSSLWATSCWDSASNPDLHPGVTTLQSESSH